MKQILLAVSAVLTFGSISAQVAIPNGGLESWSTTAMAEPNNYVTANQEVVFGQFAAWPCQQTTDAQLNNFAVRLETQDNGQDTMFGYFANGDPGTGEGGIAYAARPSALTGYWKGNIMPGDTALVLVIFKLGGSQISFDLLPIVGTTSSYTAFTLPITLPPIITPDSVIVAAVSSNAFVTNGIPGSWIQLDNFVFTGVTSQPTMLNGDFESWNMSNYYDLNSWTLAGDSALRTTDSYQGVYAVELGNFTYNSSNYSPSYLTNGYFVQNSLPMGGFPYSGTTDTLQAYYKFSGGAGDTAFLIAIFTGPNPGDTAFYIEYLLQASNYTMIEIPMSLSFTPDSLVITAASDVQNPPNPSNIGNTLIIDEIQLTSQPLDTRISINWQAPATFLIYPNPNSGQFTLDIREEYSSVQITDIAGRVVFSDASGSSVAVRRDLDLSEFGAGTYFVNVTSGVKVTTKKVVVQ